MPLIKRRILLRPSLLSIRSCLRSDFLAQSFGRSSCSDPSSSTWNHLKQTVLPSVSSVSFSSRCGTAAEALGSASATKLTSPEGASSQSATDPFPPCTTGSKRHPIYGVGAWQPPRLWTAGTPATSSGFSTQTEQPKSINTGGGPGPGIHVGRLPKRFYKEVSVLAAAPPAQGWLVTLDGRTLRTPAKALLALPSKSLALGIAAEWHWQDPGTIKPFTMPLMKLASTTIDQIPCDRPRVVEQLLGFLHTDALCCRAPEGSALSQLQAQKWDPVLSWAEAELGARPSTHASLLVADQEPALVASVRALLEGLTDWELAAVDALASGGRSVLVALAVLRGGVRAEEAVELVRLEENFQVAEWGFVEGGHDIDVADLRVRMMAPLVFLRLLQRKDIV